MAEKITYKLMQDFGLGFVERGDFESATDAEHWAKQQLSREYETYKIVRVHVVETELPEFTVPPYVPGWEEVAANLSSVYAGSIDWTDEDYLALSEEDRAKAKREVIESTDDCECCGWTFQSDYLSDTDHGRVCDRCEADLEAQNEEDEEDED